MDGQVRIPFLLAIVLACPVWAQPSTTIDSLLDNTKLSTTSPEVIVTLLSRSVLMSAPEHDRARIHDRIAHAYRALEILDSASVHAWHVLRLAPQDNALKSRAYALLGSIAFQTEAFQQSEDFYASAGRLCKLMDDKPGQLEALVYQARINHRLQFVEEALTRYAEAKSMASELKDIVTESQLLFEMGQLSRTQGRFSNAEDFLNRSQSLSSGDTLLLARVRRELGRIEEERFDYKGARRHYQQLLHWMRDTDPFPLYHDLIRLSIGHQALDTAKRYADSAEIAAVRSGSVKYLRDCYQSRYQLAELMKDSSAAYAFLLKFKVFDDSVKSGEMERRAQNIRHELFLSASEASVRTAELQAQLNETNERTARNERNLAWLATALGILAALFLALWFFTWRRSRDRIRDEMARTKDLNAKNAKVFAVMAHDLQGPVSTFGNLTRSMPALLKESKPEEVTSMIRNLHISAQELQQSLHELMDWAVTQSGAMSSRPEMFSCLKLAEQVKDELHAWADEHGVASTLLVPEGVTTYADRAMIKIVLRTLLFNAIRFSAEGQTVTLFSGRKEDLITMGVKDNGQGIDQGSLQALLSWENEGTAREKGVGLPMCRELVRRNGGELYAESQVGHGSTFYFTLPERPPVSGEF